MKFTHNIKSVFSDKTVVTELEKDRADLVQTVLLIAGFAIAALLTVNWLSTAILNKAADSAECIEGSNSYNSSKANENCASADHAKTNSFKKDKGYEGRYNK